VKNFEITKEKRENSKLAGRQGFEPRQRAPEAISCARRPAELVWLNGDMRIVALSDQHSYLPEIPPCDLLIIAGDVCPDRFGPFLARHDPDQQKSWFNRKVRPWLAKASATHKILTWGNHDWCGQARSFRHDSPTEASTTALQILVDEATRVPAGGECDTSVSIWATPWSNQFMNWAFMKAPVELTEVYAAIPEGIDILVSHQPPFGYADRRADSSSGKIAHLGSRELLVAIDRVRPKLVICGHIHDGYGRYEYEGIPIYNVSVVDEQYRLVHPPTQIDFP
jgi:predicted MPP superfamily phosphohydrolase